MSPAILFRLAAFAMGLIALTLPVGATLATDGPVAEAARSVFADRALQTDLPAPIAEPDAPPPERRSMTLPPWVGDAIKVALILAGTVLAILMVREVLRAGWRGRPPVTVTVAPEATARSMPPAEPEGNLGAADTLAQAGRFAEAVHMLLHLAERGVARHGLAPVRDSSTSREILRALRLAEEPRQAHGDLVGMVEAIRFAGAVADQALYERARDRFGKVSLGLPS